MIDWSLCAGRKNSCRPNVVCKFVNVRGGIFMSMGGPVTVKSYAEEQSVGQTSAGDALIESKTGEPGVCSYCTLPMFLVNLL